MPRILAKCICFCCCLPCNGCGPGRQGLYRRLRASLRKRGLLCDRAVASNSERTRTTSGKERESVTEELRRKPSSSSSSLSHRQTCSRLIWWNFYNRACLSRWRRRAEIAVIVRRGQAHPLNNNNNNLCCWASLESLQTPEEKYANFKGLRVVTLKKVSNIMFPSFCKLE